jgi:hypothetical protein
VKKRRVVSCGWGGKRREEGNNGRGEGDVISVRHRPRPIRRRSTRPDARRIATGYLATATLCLCIVLRLPAPPLTSA